MPEETAEILAHKKNLAFSPRELVFKYLHYLPWVIVSVVLMMAMAYIKLRYSTPIYSVSGKLLVKIDNNPFSGNNEKFDDIFAMQSKSSDNVGDEIEVIKSRSMAARVVNALKLQTLFYNKGKIRTAAIQEGDLPFAFKVLEMKDSLSTFGMLLTIVNGQQYKLDQNPNLYNFGQVVDYPFGKFIVTLNNYINLNTFASKEFIVVHSTVESRAAELSGQLKVAQSGDMSNVILLTYENENTKIGLDIINQFMEEYQKSTLEDKREMAVNTASFIEEQLSAIQADLSTVERNLLGFREKNLIFAPEEQSHMVFSELTDATKDLTELEVKVKVLDMLSHYISDESNPYRTVPATMGIQEPSLFQQVAEYNNLVVQREVELKSTPATNPLIKKYESGLEKIRQDMLVNLQNIRKSYEVAIESIRQKTDQASSLIRGIPGKEKQLLDVTRQQKILEELYSFLLQKKLETAISSASTISNVKVLEPAMGSGAPVSPNSRGIYTFFIFMGLAIPVGIIFLLEYLNDKVKSKADIEKTTDTPILGEIGHVGGGGALVVTKNNRQFIAEQFRVIRSNLQYILPKEGKPVIMVTSSISGEGKSFLSTNLGAVLAVSGKKTAIMEFDIRKPKLMEGLGLQERMGITNYIVSNIAVKDIIYPVPNQDNLFIIPCGPIPPNPSEMLLEEKVAILFKELKEHFDAIIIDTAPVGLVSDAVTIGQYANACMYVVRHNYTFKKQIQLIDELYVNKKLPHLAVIINDINVRGGYRQYYGYGYGYGYYGYGYGSGYFDNPTKKNKSLWKRIKKIFS